MEDILYKTDRIILFAAYGNPQCHRHFSKHILLSDLPFRCTVNGLEHTVRSTVIQSQAIHAIEAPTEAKMVVFMIDETSQLSKAIDQTLLLGAACTSLPPQTESELVEKLRSGCTLEQIDASVTALFDSRSAPAHLTDPRILTALEYIDAQEILDQMIYDDLPRRICLSKSRFLHLFKSEVGIDLKNYLLLKRLEKVYDAVVNHHMTITQAAVMCGFSSSSHFASACKSHYGISLSEFLSAQQL